MARLEEEKVFRELDCATQVLCYFGDLLENNNRVLEFLKKELKKDLD